MTLSTDSGKQPQQIAIIGGGAAGFFAAITAAETNPGIGVTIYERGLNCLAKVKVSGGGRCNVTHSCFEPEELSTRYPRGARELRAAFHRWQPKDTIQWFAERGVILKTEPDGRMFPDTDDSQTIIDCFLESARQAGVKVRQGIGLKLAKVDADGLFSLDLSDGSTEQANVLCLATGSLKGSPLLSTIEGFGHTIEPLAPSLFAFDVSDERIDGLAGLSVQDTSVRALPKGNAQRGPLLVTHRGFSGPAILRLSAVEALALQEREYQFEVAINWLGDASAQQVGEEFGKRRTTQGQSLVKKKIFDELPRRLWERIVAAAKIPEHTQWAQISRKQETKLVGELVDARFKVQGKTMNKEEFVTCGGVSLREIDFRVMASRKTKNLFFAGECLNFDGITGGFNFQAAWTSGRIAGLAMADAANTEQAPDNQIDE